MFHTLSRCTTHPVERKRSMAMLDIILMLSALVLAISAAALPADPSQYQCRYAPSFSQNDVLQNSSALEAMIVATESNFYEGGSGYSYSNGLTKEYRNLEYLTGLPITGAGNEHLPETASTPRNEVRLYLSFRNAQSDPIIGISYHAFDSGHSRQCPSCSTYSLQKSTLACRGSSQSIERHSCTEARYILPSE